MCIRDRLQALTIRPEAKNINNLRGQDVRDVVRWAYDENTSIGDVSQVYRLDDAYVIATLKSKTEKDQRSFEAVRNAVKRDYVNDKKAEIILEKLGSTTGKSVDDIVDSYGQGASANEQVDVSFGSRSINRLGNAPNVVGTAYKLKQGETSEPLKENNGIVVVQVTSVTEPLKQQTYDAYKTDLASKNTSAISGKMKGAIEDHYSAKNLAYRFY